MLARLLLCLLLGLLLIRPGVGALAPAAGPAANETPAAPVPGSLEPASLAPPRDPRIAEVAVGHLERARVLVDRRQYASALPHFREAVRRGGVPGAIFLELASVAMAADSPDVASAALERYLADDSENRTARIALARTLGWSGQRSQAVAEYRALLSSGPDAVLRQELVDLVDPRPTTSRTERVAADRPRLASVHARLSNWIGRRAVALLADFKDEPDPEPRMAGRAAEMQAEDGLAVGTAASGRGWGVEGGSPGGAQPGAAADQRVVVAFPAPGAVVTHGVAVPRRAGKARYRIDVAPGVKVFGGLVGTLVQPESGQPILPVTFTLGREMPAGRQTVGWVTVEWEDGERWTAVLETVVAPERELRLALQASTAGPAPGSLLELRYQIANRGNAPDTVDVRVDAGIGWQVLDGEMRHVVPAGGVAAGRARIRVPAEAPLGEQRLLRALAVGRGSRAEATLEVRVGVDPWSPGGASQLPLTVFLGAATSQGAGSPLALAGVAVRGEGEIAHDTQVWLDLRHAPPYLGNPVLDPELAGPGLRLGVRRPDWSAALGDLLVETTPLAGFMLGGRGVRLRWTGRPVQAQAFVGRPTSPIGSVGDGHAAYAQVSASGRLGKLGAALLDRRQAAWGLGGGLRWDRSASVQYEVAGHAQRLNVEAAWLRREEEGRVRAGLGGEARYTYHGRRAQLTAQVRGVPGGMAGSGIPESQALVSGNALLAGRLRAVGFLFVSPGDDDAERSGDMARRARGGSLGLRWAEGRWSADVRGNVTISRSSWWGDGERRTVAVLGTAPIGPAILELGGEVGEGVARDRAYPIRAMRGAVRWSTPGSHGWLQANYAPEYAPDSPLQLDVGGSLQRERVSLRWGSGVRLPSPDWTSSAFLWTGLGFDLTPENSLMLGAQYRPWLDDSPWQISLGFGRRLSVPLPSLRQPIAHGVVFEDRNQNGRLDPDEPGIPGVGLRTDRVVAVTDADGRFAVWEPLNPGVPLKVDPATLEIGVVLSNAALPQRGRVDVPVLRTGAIQLLLVVRRGERVEPSASTLVHLIDGARSRRSFVSDADGNIWIGSLPPGRYELWVHRPPLPGRDVEPKRVEVDVGPGQTVRQTIVVPYAPREIRFGGSQEGPVWIEPVR